MTEQGRMGAATTETVSLVTLANFLLRWRRRLVLWMAVGAALGALLAFLKGTTFTSESAFGPKAASSASSLAGLSGLAAQFGVQVPTQEATESPDFYVALVQSREILGRAGIESYGAATEGRPLAEFYGLARGDSNATSDRIVRRLTKDVDATVDPKTEIITLTVQAPSAELAQALNARILGLLDEFNLANRQSQARAERRFAEERLVAVKDSLRSAEDRLEGFLQRNRDFRNSPELSFQQDRLAREVAFQQQLYVTLAQAFEKAKLDEVRDTPVLTVLERPSLPPHRDARRLVQRAMLGAVIAAVLALLLSAAAELRRGVAAASGEEYDQMRGLLAATRSDLSALYRRFRHPGRSGP